MHKILLKIFRTGNLTEPLPVPAPPLEKPCSLARGSLSIRHVDAGSCNACELELHALNQSIYSPETLGIRFVASPRHADALLVTGPVTLAMKEALKATAGATPNPRAIIAMGDCAINGGVFRGSYAVAGGVAEVIAVDGQIPGCPPAPGQILAFLERLALPEPHP